MVLNDVLEGSLKKKLGAAFLMALIRVIECNIQKKGFFNRAFYAGALKLTRKWFPLIEKKDLNGISWSLVPYHVIDRHIIKNGVWEPFVTQAIKNFLSIGDTFYDIGANFGYHSLLAAKIVGKRGKVISFEPNPNLTKRLIQNVKKNSIENIKLVEACVVGDKKEESRLFVPPDHLPNPGRGTLIPTIGFSAIKTKSVNIDDLLEKSQIPPPSLVKIDIEGSELDALKSMQTLLASSKKLVVILEVTSEAGKIGEPVHFLEKMNFSCLKKSVTLEVLRDGIAYEQADMIFGKGV